MVDSLLLDGVVVVVVVVGPVAAGKTEIFTPATNTVAGSRSNSRSPQLMPCKFNAAKASYIAQDKTQINCTIHHSLSIVLSSSK